MGIARGNRTLIVNIFLIDEFRYLPRGQMIDVDLEKKRIRKISKIGPVSEENWSIFIFFLNFS